MKQKNKRNNFLIMLSMLTLLKPLIFPMLIAIIMGALGFISAFGLSVFGIYAIFSAMPKYSLALTNLFLGGFETKTYLILLIMSGFLRGILHYVEQYCNHLIAFKILAVIRNKVFSAMRKLAPAKLDRKNPGQLISLIMGDIELLEVFYAHTISPIAIAFIISILLFIFYISIHPLIVIVPILSQIIIGIVFPHISSKKNFIASIELRNKIGELNGQFIDKLKGIREIIQYAYSEGAMNDLEGITEKLLQQQKLLKNQVANLSCTLDSAIMIFSILQAIISLYLINLGIISVPSGIIAIVLTSSSFAPYISLANLGNTLSQTFACGERVLSILEEEPVIKEVENGINLKESSINNNLLDVKVQNLSFSYDEKESQVLKNINLKIKQSSVIGIMGESGSGKSTLLKLLLRFWDPTNGNINYSDFNLKEINTQSLYRHINYMTQSTHLFTGTIRSNLIIAKENANEKELNEALKKASIYDFVMSLPNGLDSPIGENGVNFSGGEQQRFGIARCFLADKDMLLLDEPSSNIDSINEALILRAIINERKSKTIIFISHRPSTLAVCDDIIKIKNGEIHA